MAENNSIKRLALLVGGGPAPGINGVISAVTIEAINRNIQVFGIQNGYHYLVDGRGDRMRRLSIAEVADQYWRGGSILGTSRTNPVEKLNVVLNVLRKVGIDALVSIGGDDTAFSASKIYEGSRGAIKVAHVPKTIDNDLPLPGSAPTFGFETARHLGTHIVRNLHEDARTTSPLVRCGQYGSRGRSAGVGHWESRCGHVDDYSRRISRATRHAQSFVRHHSRIDPQKSSGKTYHGVAVLAEGLIESIGEEALTAAINEGELGRYGRVERDPHGHLRLGEIEFSRMIRDLLTNRVGEFGLKTRFIDKDLGYELAQAPIRFRSISNTLAIWVSAPYSSCDRLVRTNLAALLVSPRAQWFRCLFRK